MASSENPVFRMDIVLSINRDSSKIGDPDFFVNDKRLVKKLKKFFSEYCNQWVFQLECPEDSENYHYQCRVNMKNKCRSSTFAAEIYNEFCGFKEEPFYRIGVLPTNKNPKTRFSYVMKEEGRIQGPFSDRKVYNGEDLINDLYPYQRFIYEVLTDRS